MRQPVRIIGQVLGLLLVATGTISGAATLVSLVRSHVIFIEARIVMLAFAGALVIVGLLLVLLCRPKALRSKDER